MCAPSPWPLRLRGPRQPSRGSRQSGSRQPRAPSRWCRSGPLRPQPRRPCATQSTCSPKTPAAWRRPPCPRWWAAPESRANSTLSAPACAGHGQTPGQSWSGPRLQRAGRRGVPRAAPQCERRQARPRSRPPQPRPSPSTGHLPPFRQRCRCYHHRLHCRQGSWRFLAWVCSRNLGSAGRSEQRRPREPVAEVPQPCANGEASPSPWPLQGCGRTGDPRGSARASPRLLPARWAPASLLAAPAAAISRLQPRAAWGP
mmetsp:Transcript_28636/g.65985  ORF Transcript_28636/g.65985 Transcript_28636/m.65985 type:complete len:257 (-) Transcript_28636:1495-2265(-)